MSEHKSVSNDWFLRFVKGIFIGAGFIVPGVSGGALAAIFGLYEPLINFLANITKDFKKNIKFFLPVGLGGISGIIIFSWLVSYAMGSYGSIINWFFVGAILGTLPSLWKEAGHKGRGRNDYIFMVVSFVLAFILLFYGQDLFTSQFEASFGIWMVCGGLIALGTLIPGLSPSNFIVYMGLYKDMSDGFKTLDMAIIIPIAIGGLVTVLLLSKLIEKIFNKFYSQFYHTILGVVFASTLMIIPTNYQGFSGMDYLWCVVMLVVGAWLGWWMAQLEEKYK